jgi:hypothetical protein
MPHSKILQDEEMQLNLDNMMNKYEEDQIIF